MIAQGKPNLMSNCLPQGYEYLVFTLNMNAPVQFKFTLKKRISLIL